MHIAFTVTRLPPINMFRWVAFAFLLVAAQAAYPRYQQVVRDPRDFEFLYSSASGSVNETWYFTTAVNLTSIIIPSQIFNFWSSGPWANGTYKEQIEIYLYETKLARYVADLKTGLVATGSFNGTAGFGQELEILLQNSTIIEGYPVQTYISSITGYRYTVNIVFRQMGIYPWYTKRVLSSFSCVHTSTNVAGLAIGLTFSIG